MQLGDHGVHLVCAVGAVMEATEYPLEYASNQSAVERIIVKEKLRDSYPATNTAVLVSSNINGSLFKLVINTLLHSRTSILGRLAEMD